MNQLPTQLDVHALGYVASDHNNGIVTSARSPRVLATNGVKVINRAMKIPVLPWVVD